MPVWHALSKPWREQYDLAVVGIAQEQHPERCELYARWQGFDWPILWDPFNLTGAQAVPNVYLLDERGIVLAVGPRPEEVAALLERPAPPADEQAPDSPAPRVVQAASTSDPDERATWEALSRLLFASDPAPAAVEALVRWAAAHPDDPAARFRAGVALRLRHDGPTHRPGDFQAALDAWAAALAARPGAYIWRRRIQQYGPTLDKPYPFYPWVAEARAALVERGEQPPSLGAQLTEAERAAPGQPTEDGSSVTPAATPEAAPIPAPWQLGLPDDDTALVGVETAVAAHTRTGAAVVRVHLTLRPDPYRQVHWDDEPGAPEAWLSAPEGWTIERPRRVLPPADDPTGPRLLDVEVALPAGASGALDVTLVYSVCQGLDGVCASFRQSVPVTIRTP